jgi:hypothetical protein
VADELERRDVGVELLVADLEVLLPDLDDRGRVVLDAAPGLVLARERKDVADEKDAEFLFEPGDGALLIDGQDALGGIIELRQERLGFLLEEERAACPSSPM